ncbi:MAG: heme o synthase [Halobacteriales archaeon]|nr:heme o synthase [Halobacteriales archaeon]
MFRGESSVTQRGWLLAGATIGVYVLLMAGATTAITDAITTCQTWPTCGGRWIIPLDEPRLAIAWGHRLIAAVVGIILIAAVVTGVRATDQRRVQAALLGALVLYPIQIGIGAMTAITGAATPVAFLHLVAGMGLFGCLLGALAWTLEPDEAADPDPTTPKPEPTPTTNATPASSESQNTATTTATRSRLIRRLSAYGRLMKPRLMWLLCLVAAAAMALAAGEALTVSTVVATMVGGVLAIGASGTFNHLLERDIDRRMQRTADRPLATDEVGVRNATAFGIMLATASVAVFLSINVLAAALGLAAILYYSVIYTLVLKPNTVQNTVIGGLAGSFPALIGAAAATRTIGTPALLLATVIFLWTPAHFYNLALAYKEDYERGGFPMMPVVRGDATTRKHILWYLGATLVATTLLAAVSPLGVPTAVTGVAFGAVFLWAVVRLHHDRSTRAAFRAFHASNAYLGALLLVIVIDMLAV